MERDEIKRRLPIRAEFERRGVEFKQSGSTLVAKCPFHEDGNPSLSLNEKDGVFFCHACQAKGSVIDAWALFQGVSAMDALKQIEAHLGGVTDRQERPVQKPKENPPTPPSGKKIVKEYNYTDEEGELLFQVVRFEPKDFRQRHRDGDGWKWGLNGTRRVLYNLPQVLASDSVFFTEGEKDADTLTELGTVATTVPMGAGKWDDSYSEAFKGKKVYLFPDNDGPGQEHAKLVCQKLDAYAYGVYILKVPKPHKDVTDWKNSLPSAQQFAKEVAELMRKAKAVAGADTLPIYSMEEMEARYIEELNRPSRYTLNLGILAPSLGKAIRPVIAGEFVTILADTGVGKTFILQKLPRDPGVNV
jgi:DNA primase